MSNDQLFDACFAKAKSIVRHYRKMLPKGMFLMAKGKVPDPPPPPKPPLPQDAAAQVMQRGTGRSNQRRRAGYESTLLGANQQGGNSILGG